MKLVLILFCILLSCSKAKDVRSTRPVQPVGADAACSPAAGSNTGETKLADVPSFGAVDLAQIDARKVELKRPVATLIEHGNQKLVYVQLDLSETVAEANEPDFAQFKICNETAQCVKDADGDDWQDIGGSWDATIPLPTSFSGTLTISAKGCVIADRQLPGTPACGSEAMARLLTTSAPKSPLTDVIKKIYLNERQRQNLGEKLGQGASNFLRDFVPSDPVINTEKLAMQVAQTVRQNPVEFGSIFSTTYWEALVAEAEQMTTEGATSLNLAEAGEGASANCAATGGGSSRGGGGGSNSGGGGSEDDDPSSSFSPSSSSTTTPSSPSGTPTTAASPSGTPSASDANWASADWKYDANSTEEGVDPNDPLASFPGGDSSSGSFGGKKVIGSILIVVGSLVGLYQVIDVAKTLKAKRDLKKFIFNNREALEIENHGDLKREDISKVRRSKDGKVSFEFKSAAGTGIDITEKLGNVEGHDKLAKYEGMTNPKRKLVMGGLTAVALIAGAVLFQTAASSSASHLAQNPLGEWMQIIQDTEASVLKLKAEYAKLIDERNKLIATLPDDE